MSQGHIRRRGQHSWAVVVDLGIDAGGKRRQKWHSVKGTRRDAERERARLLHEINTGSYIEPSRLSTAQYLRKWLRDSAEPNVSRKTAERYREIVELHLIPALGTIPLVKLAPLHIQDYYVEALKTGRRDGRGALSAQTVLHHHRVLRQALKQAVRWQLLTRNVADAVDPPRPVRSEMQVLDDAEIVRMLDSARGTRYYGALLIAVTTGMRRGEILALRWDDVDLKAKLLRVQRSLEQTNDGIFFKAPKTHKSKRAIALPAVTLDYLNKQRVAHAARKLSMGSAYNPHDLVICLPDGEPWPPDSFSAELRTYLRSIGVTVRFHDLRHTHATVLLRQGVHPKIVSERLGHSTVGMTLDVYSHVLPDMQADAALRVDEALAAARAPA